MVLRTLDVVVSQADSLPEPLVFYWASFPAKRFKVCFLIVICLAEQVTRTVVLDNVSLGQDKYTVV